MRGKLCEVRLVDAGESASMRCRETARENGGMLAIAVVTYFLEHV